MNENTEKYHKNQRTEEVQDIIDRMPSKFGNYTMYIIIFIVSLLFIFGFLIKYPDIVTGKITINTASQSVKLVANSTGKIHLFSKDFISEVDEINPLHIYKTPFLTILLFKSKTYFLTF